jgi:DNA-binding NarL/FixJ family response regulator
MREAPTKALMKLLIIDDHPLFRDGFEAWIQTAAPGTIVLQAKDADQGFELADANSDLDAIVLDLELHGIPGHEALARFANKLPNTPVIVLSHSEDPRDVRKSFASGALGYVAKSASQQVLLAAIRLVMSGELYIPPLILEERGEHCALVDTSALSARQIEILRLLSQGLPNKIIAAKLDLSVKTVKTHVSAIFKILGVVNRTQAASAGREAGLI